MPSCLRGSLFCAFALLAGLYAASAQALQPAAEKTTTEITCQGEMHFDAKGAQITFAKEVRVKDPQFSLQADRLTVFLKKSGEQPKEPRQEGKKPEAADTSLGSGLERVIAEGNVIIQQQRVDAKTGQPIVYIGMAQKAEYSAATQELRLTGWPRLQQGNNSQIATAEGTVMVLDRAGELHTTGPSKTILENKPKETPKP